MPEYDPVRRTRTLARIVGPYFIIMGAVLLARADTMALMFPAFMENGALVLVTGAFTVMVGLVMIAAHHHWTSPAAIVLSIAGVAASVKGALLMLAPDIGGALSAMIARTPPVLTIAAAIMVLIGLWLSY